MARRGRTSLNGVAPLSGRPLELHVLDLLAEQWHDLDVFVPDDGTRTGPKHPARMKTIPRGRFDDRWNGGGFIDQIVLERLRRILADMDTNREGASVPTPNQLIGEIRKHPAMPAAPAPPLPPYPRDAGSQ